VLSCNSKWTCLFFEHNQPEKVRWKLPRNHPSSHRGFMFLLFKCSSYLETWSTIIWTDAKYRSVSLSISS
jgi:hypothetical protein